MGKRGKKRRQPQRPKDEEYRLYCPFCRKDDLLFEDVTIPQSAECTRCAITFYYDTTEDADVPPEPETATPVTRPRKPVSRCGACYPCRTGAGELCCGGPGATETTTELVVGSMVELSDV